MISSLCATLHLKAATCTASSIDLSGTPSQAHVLFYTSKLAVKLFQLGLQHCSGLSNLLMKDLAKPIILPRKLSAVVHYIYSLDWLGRSLGRLCRAMQNIQKIIHCCSYCLKKKEWWYKERDSQRLLCLNRQLSTCICKDTAHGLQTSHGGVKIKLRDANTELR